MLGVFSMCLSTLWRHVTYIRKDVITRDESSTAVTTPFVGIKEILTSCDEFLLYESGLPWFCLICVLYHSIIFPKQFPFRSGCLSYDWISYILIFLQHLIIESPLQLSLSGIAIMTWYNNSFSSHGMFSSIITTERWFIFTSSIEDNFRCIDTISVICVCNHQRNNFKRCILVSLICCDNLPQTRMIQRAKVQSSQLIEAYQDTVFKNCFLFCRYMSS